MTASPSPDAIVIGAGPAGLACAATMRAKGVSVTVVEKAEDVGSAWRNHYDRLHLHTDRKHSGLPGMAMPDSYPLYPSRAQMVEYLESYAARFDIRPVFATKVRSLHQQGTRWSVGTSNGAITAPVAVVATGIASAPYRPSWPGMEIYRGRVAHSSDYRNPAPYPGKRVLVVVSAIRAARSLSISPKQASTSRWRFAARFRSCRAICSVCQS